MFDTQAPQVPDTLEPLTALLLTAPEAAMLGVMLQEQLTNDLDLLEDCAHFDRLAEPVSDAAIARVAFATRLEATLA